MPARKHSRQRDAILECVRSTDSHPTAEWVYARLKPEFPNLSLATVYRNLALLKQEGIITSMGVVDGMERFDSNTKPHSHFICTCCSAVIDVFEIEPPAELCEKVQCGSVRTCDLIFTGICNQCAEKCAEK